MEFLFGIFIGCVVGWILFCDKKPAKPSGTFIIDVSDIDSDLCRLELDENLNSLYYKKQIVLNVVTISDESQD